VNELGSAYVRLRSDSSGYQAEVERGVKAGFANVRHIVGGAFAAAGVFEGAKAVIESAAEHQSAFAVVDQTLENARQSTELYGTSVEALLEKEARLKGFHDEDLASSFVRLVSATHDSARAFKDLGLAEDVARARHIDVTVAALALSRAEQGSTQSLSRLGVVIHHNNSAVAELKHRHDEAVASGAKFNAQQKLIYQDALLQVAAQDKVTGRLQAFDIVQQRFGGSAAKFAQTASGQFQRTEQDIHQLEVAVGAHALPIVNDLAEGIGKYAVELTHSELVQSAVAAGLHDIVVIGVDLRDVLREIGPPLLDIATVGAQVVSAIGAPALIAATGTYKVLGVATAAVATAEAFYQRALLAGMPVKAEATAANAALASSEVAVAGAGDAAAAGGLGAFARGVGALGLASAGGVTGVAVAGLAVLAGTFVYLGTRESDIERSTNELRTAFDLLGGSLNKTRALADAVAQSRIDVALAKDARAAADAAVQQAAARERETRGTSDHAAAVLALRTARDQDRAAALGVTQAEERHNHATNQQIANERAIREQRKESLQATLDLAAAEHDRNAAIERGRFGTNLSPAQEGLRSAATSALDAQASAQFIKTLADNAERLQAKNPGLATSLRLLEQFTRDIGTLPSRKEIQFILDPSHVHQSLGTIERELLTGAQNAAVTAARGGHDIGSALGDGITAGIDGRSDAVEAAMKATVGRAHEAGRAAAEAHSPSRRTAREIGLPLAEGIVVGINTGAASVQSALKDVVGQAVEQGAQQLRDSINQAKQNLNSIGGTIAGDITQILNQPLQAEQQRLTASQNRLTLDQLKRSVILPGGRTLSGNDAVAERQLRALAGRPGTNHGALQGFLLQFEQARLAVRGDQATAAGNAATRSIADTADLANRGVISASEANRRITRLLARDHITFAKVGRENGIAYLDGFKAQLEGFREQLQALVGAPRLPGSGLVPSIVRPIDTLKQVTQQVAQAQKQRDQEAQAERKKQTAEQKKHTKQLEKIAAQQAAAKFIASLPKGEQAAVAKALAGTGR
jgi:hypothetical protein